MSDTIAHRTLAVFLGGTTAMILATAAAAACMSTRAKEEIAEGRLAVRTFKDAMGRAETAYILSPPTPQCLEGPGPEDTVKGARTLHVIASNERVRRRIGRFVGKHVHVRGTVFARHTAHHHAPIVIDITEIDGI